MMWVKSKISYNVRNLETICMYTYVLISVMSAYIRRTWIGSWYCNGDYIWSATLHFWKVLVIHSGSTMTITLRPKPWFVSKVSRWSAHLTALNLKYIFPLCMSWQIVPPITPYFPLNNKQTHTRSEVDNFHELTWSMVTEAQAPASYDLSQCLAAYLVKSVLANNKWKTRNNIISVIKYTASHKVDIDQ